MTAVTTGTHEYTTSSGHTVLLDRADWLTLRPLLDAGVRLQAWPQRSGLKVILREYRRGREPQKTMLLSKVLLGANEAQIVVMRAGPLDHRRRFMVLKDLEARQGWASHVHRMQREAL